MFHLYSTFILLKHQVPPFYSAFMIQFTKNIHKNMTGEVSWNYPGIIPAAERIWNER